MKHFSLVIFGIMSFVVSGCAGTVSKPDQPASSDQTYIRVLGERIYCSTQNKEAGLHYNRGLELATQGNLEAAVKEYQKAIELDPGYCDAMDNLGQLYRRQGSLDQAIFWYKRSVEVLPKNPVPHSNLAVAYALQGRLNEAISEYRMLTLINANDPEGYYGLGNTYIETNELQVALENLKKAEELYAKVSSPLIADAQRSLGVAYFKLKDFEKSQYYFEKIYSQWRNDPIINYTLGLCYLFGPKDLNEARKYVKRSQELGLKIPPEVMQKLNL